MNPCPDRLLKKTSVDTCLFNNQTERNHLRQQRYYKKLLAYYGGTFPMEYYRRVNKGKNTLIELRKKWREKEYAAIQTNDSILPDSLRVFKHMA